MPVGRIPAFAKVNLSLLILGKRPDGYHELRTIYQTISLHDDLTFRAHRARGIHLEIRGNSALKGEPVERNLVYRAVDTLRRECKSRSGVHILLEKRIPAGAGLGGGSSDAAAALIGYARFIRRRIPAPLLMEIAASLGSDVPFFLLGGRAIGVGRGEEVYSLPDVARRPILVVFPSGVSVATKDAYRWLGLRLTKRRNLSKLLEFCALCWSPRENGLANDFEAAVFARFPRLAAIQRELLQRGATEAALAGSGSAVFGVFRNPAQARRAAQGFLQDQAFVCETLSKERYRRAMHLRALV
ncbi:MAG TPA: 4-(cytidine 5'-diphospho)-2-C-methyl-D-erythritol kinase [Candidatus Acidoferrales bacterium]|nr:4-(cytidine 5'-diphospho)-2-C-methyl-D-erythritol kinase [Candidatus Acidoferrales bacterium]